ncbi:MAG TPA: YdeI/OmpD-associated family protein [Armatimonadota bacterium]|jgi:hypothetical protein
MKTYAYDAELCRLEGKIAWTVVYFPFPAREAFATNSRVNVTATLDGHAFDGVLLPSRNGHYLAFNQAMKDATGKAIGDVVHVTIVQDLAPRLVEVPEEIRSALAVDEAAFSTFTALPDYIKRGEIEKVTSAKQEATRRKRLDALLASLRQKSQN